MHLHEAKNRGETALSHPANLVTISKPDITKNAAHFQAIGTVATWVVARVARRHCLTVPRAQLVAGLHFGCGGAE